MIRRFAFALACAVGCAGGDLDAQAALSDLIVAKARIVQLESQLAKVSADAAVCRAQQAISTSQQQDATTKADMQAIEKEAGCKLNWSRSPVTCQAGK